MNHEDNFYRVRYLRDYQNRPLKTLVTIQMDDNIFFGISKCNPKDGVNKKLGKNIALMRAQKAYREIGNFNQVKSIDMNTLPIFVNKDETFGMVKVENVKLLLEWFEATSPELYSPFDVHNLSNIEQFNVINDGCECNNCCGGCQNKQSNTIFHHWV